MTQKIFNKSCIFPKCSYKGTTGLYKFPIKDKNRLDLWLKVCQLSSVKPHEKICKNHFNHDDFHYGKDRIVLKESAVPHCLKSVSHHIKPQNGINSNFHIFSIFRWRIHGKFNQFMSCNILIAHPVSSKILRNKNLLIMLMKIIMNHMIVCPKLTIILSQM